MTGFEPGSSGIRSDRSANCATTTAQSPWSSLGGGDEDSFLPNCQSNLVIALDAQSLLFCNFIKTAAYHWADASLHLLLAVALPLVQGRAVGFKGVPRADVINQY